MASTRHPNRVHEPSWRAAVLGADTQGRHGNASWSAILAGVVVAIAVLLTVSLVTAALGLGIADPTSNDPFDNVGWAVGLSSIVALALAVAVGGFVAGALAVRAGFMHGLAVWASSTIALVVAIVFAVSGVFGVAGSLLGSVGSAIGSGAGNLADAAGSAVGDVSDGIADSVGDVDTSGVTDDVRQVLIDTDVPELQPDYLEGQVDDIRTDIADAAQDLATNPGDYETVLDDLASSLQERVDNIADSVNEDAIADAVAKNTDLSAAEADEAVSNATGAAQDAADQFEESLTAAQDAVADAQEKIPQFVDDARRTLDDASDAAARAAAWAFVGLVIAAAVASSAGLWGSRLVVARSETGEVIATEDPTFAP